MKRTLLKRKIQTCYLRGGLLMLAVCFLLVSTKLVQAADTRIVFMSTRIDQKNGEIFVMNRDGQAVRRLTKHPQYDASPAWSPDGQKIAFISFRDEHRFDGRMITPGEIYVMNADGTNPINLTQSPIRWDRSPSWSPDGKQIVFGSAGFLKGVVQSDIWVIDADGGNRRNLTNDAPIDLAPDWSPDGLRIAFSSKRDEDWEKNPDANKDIYVMNADGTNPVNLTNHPARDGGPAWSPDGKQIAFNSNREGRHWELNPNDNWEVFVMNADGTNLINLTNHPAWDSQVSWESSPTLSVSAKKKLVTFWGKVKRIDTYGGN